MRRIIRKLKAEAKAKAGAKVEAPRPRPRPYLPGPCSARGGVAGPEQRGVKQHESPRGCCRWGPSEARCAPLVRLLLLSDPGSCCSGTGCGQRQLPGLFSARGVIAGYEQRGVEQHDSPRGQGRGTGCLGGHGSSCLNRIIFFCSAVFCKGLKRGKSFKSSCWLLLGGAMGPRCAC